MSEDLDERTAESLRELRAAMSGVEAPAHLRPAVLSEYRLIAQKKSARVRFGLWGAVAACVVLMAAGLYWRMTRSETTPVRPQIVLKTPEARPAPPDTPQQLAAVPRQRVKRHVKRTRSPRSETVDFFALPSAPPIDTAEGGSIVRVTLPRSAMRSFGIAVDELDSPDRVTADVMVGSDGMARAVRFVSLRSSR